MALAKIEKERLVDSLEKVEIIKENEAYLWYEDLQEILESKTVKWLKFLAGKKVKRILEIANKIVGLITFIQDLGGWENFKNVILKIIEVGGIEETLKKLEKK
ncbi:hypothetical protein ACE193_21560 [Bernardetia sp. OM2101]|uniref:hypothetical protein n=1 Tax=Bernardetia sp. OM2101 TaxID=3344876 RepID=UPI0035D081F9